MKDDGGERRVAFCGTVHSVLPLEICRACGAPFSSVRQLDLVKSRSDKTLGIELERTLCPDCARKQSAERLVGNPGVY